MESQFWRLVPEEISVHTSRVRLREVTIEALKEMVKDVVS